MNLILKYWFWTYDKGDLCAAREIQVFEHRSFHLTFDKRSSQKSQFTECETGY